MHHLSLDDLARLLDEAPSAEEAVHLRDCLVCRRELEGLRDQTLALRELPAWEPPPAAWGSLEARLRGEGLLRTPAPRAARWNPVVFRAAAAILLFLLGGVAGALTWGGRTPAEGPAPLAVEVPAVPAPEPTLPQPLPVAPLERSDAVMVANEAPRPESRPRRAAATRAVQRAEQELARAEAAYLAALRRYAELADPSSGAEPEVRLEALDRLVEMSARALDRAPGDPRLNGYHLAALNEREALRREIRRAAETTWF